MGQVENTFDFTPHADGSVDFAEHGTNFPDLALIRAGVVACADQATHITAAVLPAIGPNERGYSCRLSATVHTPRPPTPQSATRTLGVGTPLPLCVATPCGDGESIFIDELTFLRDADPLAPSQSVLYMRLKLKNTSSQTLQFDPNVGWSITDSTQQQVNVGTGSGAPPQCPSVENAVSLVPGDSHTFILCFELPANNDPPKVLTLGSADIPLTQAGAGVRAP